MNSVKEKYRHKIIVVAGGASGIGEQLVRQVVGTASRVYIFDRNEERALEVAAGFNNVTSISLDVGDRASLQTALDQIKSESKRIDYFFNFAGTFMAGEMRDTPIENWEAIYKLNMTPILVATELVYSIMREQGYGTIINTASAAGLFPVPVMSLYGSTKSAIVSLTLGLRAEASSFGVNACVVCPTIIDTPLYDTAIYNKVNKQTAIEKLRSNDSIQTSNIAATRILRHVARNKAIVHTSFKTSVAAFFFHLFPSMYLRISRNVYTFFRKSLRTR
jgi:short-subunit dehydrogenase